MTRSRAVTGYLSGVRNPGFSGLAIVTVRTVKKPRKSKAGKRHEFPIESGHGLRQLDAALGFTRDRDLACNTRCRWTVGDYGALADVEVL